MQYDYVIVGAGSGGSALAARLTEDGTRKVLLVESGPDYDRESIPEDLLDASEVSVQKHDWGMEAFFLEPQAQRAPQPYPRGKVVGGSSSVNAAIANRATVEDFDHWVELGNTEWSYEKVLPYFERLENDLDHGDEPGHGSSGPVPITRYPESEWPRAVLAMRKACLDLGHPECADFNAKGSTGFGPVPRNLLDGERRASGLLTYIEQARGRDNLTILSARTCLRILFDGTTAVGVEVRDHEGKVEQHRGGRIVLAAGAVHSPQLLTVSGVGPAGTLEAIGVEPVAVSEGVGAGFQDHILAPVLVLLNEDTPYVGVRGKLKYSSTVGSRVDDMMLFGTVMDPGVLNLPFDTQGKVALVMASLLAKPESTGWITIRSKDVDVQPEIHANFLATPEDVEPMKEGMRLAWQLATTSPLAEEIHSIVTPDAATIEDDEALERFLREIGTTSYHATSTCRMGPDGDDLAVVDQGLAVRGVQNLWVGDASVLPRVPTGLTNITAYMVGERLADLLMTSEEQQ